MSHLERVEIRVRRILDANGDSSVAHSVHCPARHESKLLVDCETCARCLELTPEAPFVVCEIDGPVPRLKAASTENTTIGKVMTGDVQCVDEKVSVRALRELFLTRNISGVPVVDAQGFPIGVVSKTDLLRAHDVTPAASASEIMMPVAFTLEESRPLADGVKLMATEGVHRLPIVDENGRVVGILSTMDILRWLDR